MATQWTEKDIPDQTGKTAIVTGANSGIGFEAARALAEKGAKVIMACRSEQRAKSAMEGLSGDIQYLHLDLGDLSSVAKFSQDFNSTYDSLDLLINNAGVMAVPKRELTKDGFEMTFGVNHLGHFALTSQLFGKISQTPSSRIVNVASSAHKRGSVDFENLNAEKSYGKWAQYSLSKLANIIFTYELQRRIDSKGVDIISCACHPGYTATNLQKNTFFEHLNGILGQSQKIGALPTLYAAVAQDVEKPDYIGPDGFFEMWGHPKKVKSIPSSYDLEIAKKLWEVSEELTKIKFDI